MTYKPDTGTDIGKMTLEECDKALKGYGIEIWNLGLAGERNLLRVVQKEHERDGLDVLPFRKMSAGGALYKV